MEKWGMIDIPSYNLRKSWREVDTVALVVGVPKREEIGPVVNLKCEVHSTLLPFGDYFTLSKFTEDAQLEREFSVFTSTNTNLIDHTETPTRVVICSHPICPNKCCETAFSAMIYTGVIKESHSD